jgi:hypothetical protein
MLRNIFIPKTATDKGVDVRVGDKRTRRVHLVSISVF